MGDDCNSADNGPELPVHDDEQMRLLVEMARDAAGVGVTNDLAFRRFLSEFVGYTDAEQATAAWKLSGGSVVSESTGKPSYGSGAISTQSEFMREVIQTDTGNPKPQPRGETGKDAKAQALRDRLDAAAAKSSGSSTPSTEGPERNMRLELERDAVGATNPTPAPSDVRHPENPQNQNAAQLAEEGLNPAEFGEKTVFDWDATEKLGKKIKLGYRPPNAKGRDPKTKDELAYFGGYIYERLSRMNNQRPKFETWVAYMKASTGHNIAPQDLLDAWQTMRQIAWKTRVKHDVDIRNAALRRANRTLSPAKVKEFIENTKNIDPKSPDAHKEYKHALDELKKDDPMQLVYELPSLRRALRVSFDMSAPFMQGAIYTLDPFNAPTTARNMAHMVKAYANDKYAQAVMADLHSRPAAAEMDEFAPGLLSKFGADVDVTSHEEAYATRFFDAIAESSYENRPYSAYNSTQALPAIMAATVGVPLMAVTTPLLATPAALLAGKFGQMASAAKPVETGKIQSSMTLDLSTGQADKLASMIQKAFQYQPQEGESIETWDKRISREMGVFGLVPGAAGKVDGKLKTIGLTGAVSSLGRQTARDLRAAERCYTVYLNLQRMQAWERVTKLMKDSGILPETHPESYKALGKVLGALTGRADIGKLEDAGTYLGWIFYSPRFQWSRVQTLATIPAESLASAAVEKFGSNAAREKYAGLGGGRFYIPKEARKEHLQALGRALAGLGILLGLSVLGGASVYLDARHRDFLKSRYQNQTFDQSGGLANWMRLLWQTLAVQEKLGVRGNYDAGGFQMPGDTTGQKLTRFTGQKYGKDAGPSTRENFEQQITGKENPIIGDWWQLHTGRNVFGDKVFRGRFDRRNGQQDFTDPEDWKGVASDMWENFGPLSVVDFVDAFGDDDRDTVEKIQALVAILGVNVKANKYKKP